MQELERPDEKQSAGAADVVTLGDAWLTPAIQRRLIQPIPNAEHSRWVVGCGLAREGARGWHHFWLL